MPPLVLRLLALSAAIVGVAGYALHKFGQWIDYKTGYWTRNKQ